MSIRQEQQCFKKRQHADFKSKNLSSKGRESYFMHVPQLKTELINSLNLLFIKKGQILYD
jgi:hypothetical protein